MNTTAYVQNQCSKAVLNGGTPKEFYTAQHHSIKYFQVFGCLSYVMATTRSCRLKFDRRSKPGIFVGYSDRKGYRFHDPGDQCVIVSQDVFLEEKRGADLFGSADFNGDL